MSPTATTCGQWSGRRSTAYGRLDTMVNNAGVTHVNRPMLEVGEEEFDRIFAVNVKAIYLAAMEALCR